MKSKHIVIAVLVVMAIAASYMGYRYYRKAQTALKS